MRTRPLLAPLALLALAVTLPLPTAAALRITGPHIAPFDLNQDSDGDGLPDFGDSCPQVSYEPGFDWDECAPMDLNPANDSQAECKARERVADFMLTDPAFITHVAFSVVKSGQLHFADAFTYVGGGNFVHDPEGIHRLFRIGSTSKPFAVVAAKLLEESGVLSFDDYVSDDDGSQVIGQGQVSLGDLLTHRGAFHLDNGALHLYCFPGVLSEFWLEPDDLVSPHYDSYPYGNLGGGYEYSAFNYSLAGTHLSHRAELPYGELLQSTIFDAAGMCTATVDGARAVTVPIGERAAVSEGPAMPVGPYINWTSTFDSRCEDNFYSSEDLPGDIYDWQYYHLDEADAGARDPAGGVIASVVDMAHFAETLLDSYWDRRGLISPEGIRELWTATTDLGCDPWCPYEPYYGVGFFTDSQSGEQINEVQHGGSRPGFSSAFVVRPEDELAIAVLANGDASTVTMSDLSKIILDEFSRRAPSFRR